MRRGVPLGLGIMVLAFFFVRAGRARAWIGPLGLSPYAGRVTFNEVLANQTCSYADATSNDEFVELYFAADVDLSGWTLSDGNVVHGDTDGRGGFAFVFPTGSVFHAGDYAVIWLGDANPYGGLKNAPLAAGQFYVGVSPKLSNTGDDLWLFDASGRIVDYMAYGSGSAINDQSGLPMGMWTGNAAKSNTKGQSLSVSPDSTDADGGVYWERTTEGDALGPTTWDTDDQTCGTYERVSSAGRANHAPPPPSVLEPSPAVGAVVINEVLAAQTCSSRTEEHDEFVELYIRAPVDLSGWTLSDGNVVHGETDGSGGFAFTFPPGSAFRAGDFVVVWLGPETDPLDLKHAPHAAGEFYAGVSPKLNNDGDDLWLFDDQNRIVDYMAYGSSSAINPWSRLPGGFWSGHAPKGKAGQSVALVPNGWDINHAGTWQTTGEPNPPGPWAQDVDPAQCEGTPRGTSVGQRNHCVAVLPCTGFPKSVTLPFPTFGEASPYAVTQYHLYIPKLGVDAAVLMAPLSGTSWDVDWLWDQVGWLEGTAFPGTEGNTVLTAHRWLPSGAAGPFAYLDRLTYGDTLHLTLGPWTWTYTVVAKTWTSPDALWPLQPRAGSWLTLITCAGYDPETGLFRTRLVVQARQ